MIGRCLVGLFVLILAASTETSAQKSSGLPRAIETAVRKAYPNATILHASRERRHTLVADLRTSEVAWWEDRQCYAAFLELAGQENISESRVTEIKAGTTIPPVKIAVEDVGQISVVDK